MAGASSSALMDLVSTLEAPFLSSWATLKDHDARPFGGVMWLPKMAVVRVQPQNPVLVHVRANS